MEVFAVQDGDLLRRRAVFDQLPRDRRNKPCLIHFIARLVDDDRIASPPVGVEIFGFATAVFFDHAARGGENGASGAVVLLKRYHFRTWENFFKLK